MMMVCYWWCAMARWYGSEVITIDDEVIDVDTCDSSQTSESTTMTLSLDWNSAPSAAATRSLLRSSYSSFITESEFNNQHLRFLCASLHVFLNYDRWWFVIGLIFVFLLIFLVIVCLQFIIWKDLPSESVPKCVEWDIKLFSSLFPHMKVMTLTFYYDFSVKALRSYWAVCYYSGSLRSVSDMTARHRTWISCSISWSLSARLVDIVPVPLLLRGWLTGDVAPATVPGWPPQTKGKQTFTHGPRRGQVDIGPGP